MKAAVILVVLALVAPAAGAETYYAFPVVQSALSACLDRRDSLEDRKAFLDLEKRGLDRESDWIGREGARLEAELRRLDNRDAPAVADYNRRSDEQNLRVDSHNRRVAEMNSAASTFNGDAADMTAYCNWRASRPNFAGTPR